MGGSRMAKLIAIGNVIAWSGFWAFGYLALTSDPDNAGRMVTALILAALGAAVGIAAWLWIVRHSEDIGYAPKPKRALPEGAGPVNSGQ